MITAVYLLMFSIPLLYSPLSIEEFETPKAWALMTFSFLSFAAIHWRRALRDPATWALVFFTASAAISTYFSIDRRMSVYGNWRSANGLLVQVSYLIFYAAASTVLVGYRDRINLVRVVLAASFVVATYALLQVCGIDFQTWAEMNIELGYMRPPSSLGHPNFMAAYLAMTLPFAIWRIQKGKRLEMTLCSAAALLSVAAIVASQSRGMWLAAATGLITYFYFTRARLLSVMAAGVTVALAAGALCMASPRFRDPALNRLHNIVSLESTRIEYPAAAWRIWKRNPFIGVGTDAYEVAFDHQRTPYYWRLQYGGSPHRAHMEFLNVLATQGALGGLCVLFLTWLIIEAVWNTRRSQLFAPAIASISAAYVQELSSFHVVATGTMFLVSVALLRQEERL